MNRVQVSGPSRIITGTIIANENLVMKWLTTLFYLIMAEDRILDDWECSVLLSVFKGKGDPMQCGSYRTIKLL